MRARQDRFRASFLLVAPFACAFGLTSTPLARAGPVSDVPPDIAEDETPKAKPLPPPRAGEQEPRPYFAHAEDPGVARPLEFVPVVGVWQRVSANDAVSYAPGLAFGAALRMDFNRWLGLRAVVARSWSNVSAESPALTLGAYALEQPSLITNFLGARLEPTLEVTTRFRIWLGVGAGWAHVVAPAPAAEAGVFVGTGSRTASLVELDAAPGASVELIPGLLTLNGELLAGLVVHQSGSLFEVAQGIDPEGHLGHYSGLARFSASFAALFGLGLIL